MKNATIAKKSAPPPPPEESNVILGTDFRSANQNQNSSTDNRDHFGFTTHFFLNDELKETAKRLGLNIQKHKSHFRVTSAHGPEALQTLAAPFADTDSDDSITLERKQLVEFLKFLHRPLDHTLGKEKRTGHHISRFLTTGRADIPLYTNNALENAKSLSCHMKGQRKMQEDDVWRIESEFANPKHHTEPEDAHFKLVSAIPGTTYDPEKGFVFEVAPAHANGFEGKHQSALSETMWNALNAATNNRYSHENHPPEIALSSAELQKLYTSLQTPDVQTLIRRSIREEKSQQLYNNVLSDSKDLENDARFNAALKYQTHTLAPEDKLKNLLRATTTMTPILKSDAVLEAWKSAFVTEDWLNLTNPAEDIPEQIEAFTATAHKMLLTGQTNDASIQALVNNSKELLSFISQSATSIAEATEDKKAQKLLPPEHAQTIQNNISKIGSALGSASVNGIQSGDAAGYYDEILSSLKSAFEQNGNLATKSVVGAFNTWKEFAEGVVESVYDSPPAFALLASLVGYAYYTKYGSAPDPEMVQQAVDTVFSGWGGTDSSEITITQQTIENAQKAHELIVNAARENGDVDEVLINPNVHYNYILPQPVLDFADTFIDGAASKYLAYRHWVGENIIASGAMTAQNAMVQPFEIAYSAANIPVNYSSNFVETSQAVTSAAGSIAVDLNTFQDGSHASMAAYATYRAAKYGPGAAKGMLGLAAEFINPATAMARPIFRPIKNISANTLGFTGLVSPERAASWISPKTNHRRNILEQTLHIMANDELNFAQPSKAPIQTTKFTQPANLKIGIGWYGLNRHAITIDQNNIKNLKNALNNLALTLDYSAHEIGIEVDSYTHFVKDHVEKIEHALNAYQENQDQESLQKTLNGSLQHVMAAELKFNDRDDIYNAVMPTDNTKRGMLKRIFTDNAETLDNRKRKTLERHASKKHGRLGRVEKRAEFAQRSTESKNDAPKPDTLFSKGALKYAWGATKAGYNKTRHRSAQLINLGIIAPVVNISREAIHEPLCQIPLKKKFATAALTLGSIGTAMDMARVENAFTQATSTAAAVGTSITTSGSTFLALNIPQDAALHTLFVGGCLALGSAWYGSVNRGLKPLATSSTEYATATARGIFKRSHKDQNTPPTNDLH